MDDTFYIKNFVDMQFETTPDNIDHEKIAGDFMQKVQEEMDDQRFERLLTISGFIPDLYLSDSSQETLFSKMVECLVAEWARRMGFSGEIIKQKASYEDVKITIDSRIVVCDAKSFRLGRSQAAPNPKDFLKLEDIRKWMDRYSSSIGGLVTYPCKHEWTKGSDIYQYCSTADAPTVMLPYKYLSYLLHHKGSFSVNDLTNLWDYKRIFPDKLPQTMAGGNKTPYWNKIDAEIVKITGTSKETLRAYMDAAGALIADCVNKNIAFLQNERRKTVDRITEDVNKVNDIAQLRAQLQEYMVQTQTKEVDQMLERIKEFRK